MQAHFPGVAAALAMIVLTALAGCSRDDTARQVGAMNASNVQRVANMYAAFQHYNGGRGPSDEGEFQAFIKHFAPSNLAMMGIDPNHLDALLTSERDGKPFKIRYKAGGGRGAVVPVVFEQEGKDGKKQVGFTGGRVDTVDDATYQQLWSGRGSPRPADAPTAGVRPGPPKGVPAGAPTGPPGK